MLNFFNINDEGFQKYDNYMRALAIIVLIVGVLLSGFLAYRGVQKLAAPDVMLKLKGVSGVSYNALFSNVKTPHALIFLYRKDCKDCDKQMKNILTFKKNEQYPRVTFFLVSMDDDPIAAIKQLRKEGFEQEDEFALYYAAPNDQTSFSDKLMENGSQGYESLPHTLILDNTGRVLIDYSGTVSPSELDRNISVFRRKDPKLNLYGR